ncbi:hydroxyethylthiazole kinase [Candidatus Micrarchaeota archaeon CG08_land_8_20_14_0_20_49_17]|nr:MAG: hydroxyethylthiazole kinase [Candidatus Micrarchaeota archaeon CG08_land_8_20_14_0_20_49_17]PIZ96066.1 MAG: hydroxyethylthiazole kinase [Candidatus Micrarchaeota archaeon CG_4_10_14_0_2_um_filter_49_7]
MANIEPKQIASLLAKIKQEKPLIHHITNWVTIYDCANITRTIGALPVMAHAPEEVEEMTGIASALVLNIGTLTEELMQAMYLAGKAANKKGIPVVVDAVGVGATKFRTEKFRELAEKVKLSVIKGNISEMGIIAGVKAEVKGVEAMSVDGTPEMIAKKVAAAYGCTAAITGKTDVVSDGAKTFLVNNGHLMMGSIVGTGCMAASAIGVFAAVEKDRALASASALSVMGIAGELAAAKSNGPGTFKEAFFDEMYNLNEAKIAKYAKVELP